MSDPAPRKDGKSELAVKLPPPVPQILVGDLEHAILFYQTRLGFTLDWKYQDDLAGVSREESRLFLNRVAHRGVCPVRVWVAPTSSVGIIKVRP